MRPMPGNTTPQTVGQLELDRFPNEAGLKPSATISITKPPASGSPQAGVPGSTGYGTIQQGFWKPPTSIRWRRSPSLITAQRAYEMNSKVVTAADQMLQQTAQLGA